MNVCFPRLIKHGVIKFGMHLGNGPKLSGNLLCKIGSVHVMQTDKKITNQTHTYTTMASEPKVLDKGNLSEFLQSYDTFMLDCDGTLWEVDHITAIPGIDKVIHMLNKLGKRILFVTNNSVHSNLNYKLKFQSFGFDASEDHIFGVAYATAVYLKDIAKMDGLVYLVGSPGMASEFSKAGINYFGFGADPDKASWDPKDLLDMEFRPNVKAVVVGYDEHFHYNKIYKAASYLQDSECMYVASNDVEISFPLGPGRMQPVTGTLVKTVSIAARREPIVVGKPHPLFLDCVMKKHPEIVKERTVFIGDSLKADIGFANNVGIDSAFVLTGTHNLNDMNSGEFPKPTYVMQSLADILDI